MMVLALQLSELSGEVEDPMKLKRTKCIYIQFGPAWGVGVAAWSGCIGRIIILILILYKDGMACQCCKYYMNVCEGAYCGKRHIESYNRIYILDTLTQCMMNAQAGGCMTSLVLDNRTILQSTPSQV